MAATVLQIPSQIFSDNALSSAKLPKNGKLKRLSNSNSGLTRFRLEIVPVSPKQLHRSGSDGGDSDRGGRSFLEEWRVDDASDLIDFLAEQLRLVRERQSYINAEEFRPFSAY